MNDDDERDPGERVDDDDVERICRGCGQPVGAWHEEWCAVLARYRAPVLQFPAPA